MKQKVDDILVKAANTEVRTRSTHVTIANRGGHVQGGTDRTLKLP